MCSYRSRLDWISLPDVSAPSAGPAGERSRAEVNDKRDKNKSTAIDLKYITVLDHLPHANIALMSLQKLVTCSKPAENIKNPHISYSHRHNIK